MLRHRRGRRPRPLVPDRRPPQGAGLAARPVPVHADPLDAGARLPRLRRRARPGARRSAPRSSSRAASTFSIASASITIGDGTRPPSAGYRSGEIGGEGMAKIEILAPGVLPEKSVGTLRERFTCHRAHGNDEVGAILAESGDRIRGMARGGHFNVDRAPPRTPAETRDHRQFRRRLRRHRPQVLRRARHRRHQHARRADRGGRRHRARPSAHDRPRTVRRRATPPCRQLGARGQLSADAVDAPRPHRRHRRPRPYRPRHRPPPRRHEGAGRLSRAARTAGLALSLLCRPSRHGRGGRHAPRRPSRHPRDQRYCRRGAAPRPRAGRHPDQYRPRRRWSTNPR